MHIEHFFNWPDRRRLAVWHHNNDVSESGGESLDGPQAVFQPLKIFFVATNEDVAVHGFLPARAFAMRSFAA